MHAYNTGRLSVYFMPVDTNACVSCYVKISLNVSERTDCPSAVDFMYSRDTFLWIFSHHRYGPQANTSSEFTIEIVTCYTESAEDEINNYTLLL